MAQTAEVVIIGGGIIGASIAYHLRQDGLSGRLIVVERDTTYSRATTPMSMGGVRQQYAAPCNIALARYSLQFYEQFDEMMGGAWGRPQAHFHQCGYLFLFDESQRSVIMSKYELQRQMGVEVELFSPQQVLDVFPHLGLDDITGAIYGRRDGYLNPRGALQGFVERTRELGCILLQDEVVSFAPTTGHMYAVQTHTSGVITTPALVLATGPWTRQLATPAGIELPVLPVRRQACYLTLPQPLGYKLPMVIDPSDVHFRHDTETDDHILVTTIVRDEPPGFNFDWDATRFHGHIVPQLQRRLPTCTPLQLQRGWAGHYDVTPDENPILGAHPEHPALFLAVGFSGHGLMLAPAVGKILSEAIRLGRSETLEAQPYRLERFRTGDLILDAQI
jgi:FAD-dependent oxidoreductase domain-containing protein 1